VCPDPSNRVLRRFDRPVTRVRDDLPVINRRHLVHVITGHEPRRPAA
jgi:hypothetical protein